MAASNTHECLEETIGHTINGLIYGQTTIGHDNTTYETWTFVFEDGTGLSIVPGYGSYWPENAEDVKRKLSREKRDLAATEKRLKDVLGLAGAL